MGKPIFVIQLGGGDPSPDDKQSINKRLDYLKEDYHVLLMFNDSAEHKFELFSEKDIKHIDLEKLKIKLGLNEQEEKS